VGVLGLAGACSGDDGGGSVSAGGESAGGQDGTGAAGKGSGATSSEGGSDTSMGGMMTSEAGMPAVIGGSDQVGGGGAGGAAGDLCEGLDLECEDDDNPCTEDECNPATGECGIPRNETACDDGLYCNGEDTCIEGECTAGEEDPCGGRTCNEAMNTCECTMDEHCAADAPGDWSECVYASVCIETGSRSRPVTTFTCTGGMCMQGATVENEACTRETDGSECPSDNLYCNGVEACKDGNCAGAGTPCKGATPFCVESSDKCNECAETAHCGGGEECCRGACQPVEDTCSIVVPTSIITTINPSIIGSISPSG
jgi:hypothetical protein